jgi:hypothetical protein
MKIVGRIVVILAMAGIFVGATAMYVHYLPPFRGQHFEGDRRRRSSLPSIKDLPGFVGQFALIGGIALVARKVLHVRLSTPAVRR